MSELASKVGMTTACQVLNVPRSAVYRSRKPKAPRQPRPQSPRALSDAERASVREILNSERFMDQSPRQVYAKLLDEGVYVCHWRTMYRILSKHGEVCERRRIRRHPTYKKPELLAVQPNQVWSWDITTLRGPVKWSGYKLYTVLDIFSRYVVGWMIAEEESSELAKYLVTETARKQHIQADQLTLHADNGGPMKGKALSQLLVDLGIERSHSRPHVSDDNPFSEAQFKTMKYRPDYPKSFDSLEAAQGWARGFFHWYNEEHYHSGLNLMTPSSVHHGQAAAVLEQRQTVMLAAYAAHPMRYAAIPQVKGAPAQVWINRPTTPPSQAISSNL